MSRRKRGKRQQIDGNNMAGDMHAQLDDLKEQRDG